MIILLKTLLTNLIKLGIQSPLMMLRKWSARELLANYRHSMRRLNHKLIAILPSPLHCAVLGRLFILCCSFLSIFVL